MNISREFSELENYKKLIEEREENLEKLTEELNNIEIEIEENKENEENKEALAEKIEEIEKEKDEEKERLDLVKTKFEESYERLMQIPEIKEIYDEEIAKRANEKGENLAKINHIYKDVVSNVYKDIQDRRGNVVDKDVLDKEMEIKISQENFKEITMDICGDILKRKNLTEKEKNLKEQIIEEYGEEAVISDELLEEIYNKNKDLIIEVRDESLEEKLKLYEYKRYNKMKAEENIYSNEELLEAKEKQKEAIEYAKKINSKKIDEYAEKIFLDKDFIEGLEKYAEINGKSEINNYFNNGEIEKENKRKIIELILNEYEDPKIREKMGKEAEIYKKAANKIYEKIKGKAKEKVKTEKEEKVEDEKEIDKEQNKEEDVETKEKVKAFYRDPEINDTLQLSPEQVKELLRQRAENPEELEFQEDEIKEKNGFFSKFKNWFVITKNKTNEKEEIEEIEDEEEQSEKQDEQENKQMQEHEEMLEQEQKEQLEKKRDEYARKIRELFREKIEQETEELARREKEKDKEDKEREK